MKYLLLFSIIGIIMLSFHFEDVYAQTYYYYVDKLPPWATHADGVMMDATRTWEVANSGLKFIEVSDPTQADFRVQWVKEFGVEHVGYAYGNRFIEVGLGDSECLGTWQPYSFNHVSNIMKHEIGHILGLDHSNNPEDIMYPVALNKEYGIIKLQRTLTNNYAEFIPTCTIKDVTSFNYQVITDDPVYGFDVYFVSSVDDFYKWQQGKPFSYYSDKSCFGNNYLSYGGTCNGVANGGGLLLIMGQKVTNPLTHITVEVEETTSETNLINKKPTQSNNPPTSIPKPPSSNSIYVDDYQQFSINYPATWIVDESPPDGSIVNFLDAYNWHVYVSIDNLENTFQGYSDKRIFEAIKDEELSLCEASTFKQSGQICYNFNPMGEQTAYSETGLKLHYVAYSVTKEYNDKNFPGTYNMAVIIAETYDGGNAWQIRIESDVDFIQTYTQELGQMIQSFELIERGAESESPRASPIPIPTPMPPLPKDTEPTISTDVGTVKISNSEVKVSRNKSEMVKIYGTVDKPNKGDKVTLVFTYPDGTTNGNQIFPTKDGYFETYITIDDKYKPGKYEVMASMKGKIVGISHFDINVDSENTITKKKSETQSKDKKTKEQLAKEKAEKIKKIKELKKKALEKKKKLSELTKKSQIKK